jgi:hypothetical protein
MTFKLKSVNSNYELNLKAISRTPKYEIVHSARLNKKSETSRSRKEAIPVRAETKV